MAAPTRRRPYSFEELTEAEKAEVYSRGFPTGNDIRYWPKLYSPTRALLLDRWTRLDANGRLPVQVVARADAPPVKVGE